MYASDLLKYCHCPPEQQRRLPTYGEKYSFPPLPPLAAFQQPSMLKGSTQSNFSSSTTSLDTLTSVAQQSFGLGLKQLDTNDIGMGFQPLSRSHASSISSNSSTSSSNSSVSSKSSLKDNQRKKRSNLPKKSTTILMTWLNDNITHPYPNSKEKMDLIRKTGLTPQQLSNWFINARRRKINNQQQQSQ